MKSVVFKAVGAIGAIMVVFAAILVSRALTIDSRQVDVDATQFEAPRDAAERLSRSVQFETVSNADPSRMEMAEFDGFNEFLATTYPNANGAMERELVEPCSVIYRWRGRDDGLKPVLLAAHTDVVPVESHEISEWTHPPFSGAIADGHVWGRGTLDDKISVLGLMEAVELLATRGHQPERSLVFAFGCDEEVGGEIGARRMAKLFADRGEEFEFALDEGLAVVDGYVPGIAQPVALIGLVEKGFATFTLTVQKEGGHSSMPPKETAIGILARAVTRLEENRMPTSLNPATRKMFETLAPHMAFGLKLAMSNIWLLEPVLVAQMSAKPSTNAAVRTTTAVTMMNAGVQDNVLAKKAVAKVNFRLAPGDSIEDVHNHIVEVVDDDRVDVKKPEGGGFGNPASEISDDDTDGYRTIRDSIRAVFGHDVIVAPGSTTGGTDVRHYQDVSDDQYRFAPLVLEATSKDTERIHGTNERISVASYRKAVAFYTEFLSRL